MAHSFKGGSGKTIITCNIAKQLAERGQRVLLIETDFSGAAFHAIFPSQNPDTYLNQFLNTTSTDLTPYIYPHSENLDVIFCDEHYDPGHKVFSRDQDWFSRKKKQLEQSIGKLEYDVIIFDTPPGLSLLVINLLVLTNDVFLLMRTDSQSIRGTNNLIEGVYKKTVDLGRKVDLRLLINQIPQVEAIDGLLKNVANRFKFQFPFISSIHEIFYQHETSYLTAMNTFLLPSENPTAQIISEILSGSNLI